MSEPTRLERNGEGLTVYGRAQMDVCLVDGWQIAGAAANPPLLLTDIPGVSTDIAAALAQHGYDTVTAVALASEAGLTAVTGIGKKSAPRLIRAAQELTGGH